MGRHLDWFANPRKALLALWALYLIPRALLVLLDVTPSTDAEFYYSRAVMLTNGEGYRNLAGDLTAFWPPGWPLVLSLVFRAFGPSVLVVGLFNLACAAGSAWLMLDLARRVAESELAARIALLLIALYPNNAGYIPLALTEAFYTLLLLAICRLLIAGRGAKAVFAAGLLLGVATLAKAQSLMVVPLVLGIAVLRAPGFRKAAWRATGKALVLGSLAALAVLPWSLRNQEVLGRFVLISENGGVTLLTGNSDVANGGYVDTDPAYVALRARTDLSEAQIDAAAKRIALDWIAAHPGKFVALMPRKLVHLWGVDGESIWSYELGLPGFANRLWARNAIRIVNQLWYVLLLLGAALAFVRQFRERRRPGGQFWDWWLLPYALALYPTAICLVFSGQARFHYPVMPFLAMSCGWWLARWLTQRGPVPTN